MTKLSKEETKRLGVCLAQMQNLMHEVQGILDQNKIRIPRISKAKQRDLEIVA